MEKMANDYVGFIRDKTKTYAVHHDRLKPFPVAVSQTWVKKIQQTFCNKPSMP